METNNMKKYDKEIQIEEKNIPILSWERQPTKKEKEAGIKERITMYQNLHTGERSNYLPDVVADNDNYFVYKRQSRNITGTYYKASSDGEYLCCIICVLSTKAVSEGEIRHWEEERRYYFSKKKEILYKPGFVYKYMNLTEDGYFKWMGCKCNDLPVDYTKYSQISSKSPKSWGRAGNSNFLEEVVKVFSPIVTVAGNRIIDLSNPGSLDYFIRYDEPFKKSGPKQKKIDELVKIPLPKITIPNKEEFEQSYSWYLSEDVYKFAVLSKIEDGFICVRTMAYLEKKEINNGEKFIYESARIYIKGKEIISCKPNNFGEYVNAPLSLQDDHWRFPILKFDKNITKNTALEYYGSIIEEIPSKLRLLMMKQLIAHPELEQLYKGGLKNIIIKAINTSYGNSWENISFSLRLNTHEKSFYDKLGLNKYQLDRCIKYCEVETKDYEQYYIIKNVKDWFESNDIKDIDNATFDDAFYIITNYHDRYFKETLKLICLIYSMKTAKDMIESLKTITSKHMERETAWGGIYKTPVIRVYNDYLNMVKQMNAKSHFKAQFTSIEDIQNKHDAAMIIYNAKKDEFQKEAFVKSVKKIAKYAYSDNNYSIVIPEVPEDLAKEGLELHHCVKSYINRVANGSTNILFLRKNSEIDKPFFTIELSNEGNVEQIHGFGNRNISTEPKIEYFIKNWMKAKNLNASNYNKIR